MSLPDTGLLHLDHQCHRPIPFGYTDSISIIGMSDSKKQPKGILRKSGGSSPKERSRSATFDEMNIIATLHPADKDYGYMKVDEPPTPYNYEYEKGKNKVLDPNVLAAQLAKSVSKPPKSETKEVPPEDVLTPEEKERRKAFEEKRKAHYNEYITAKMSTARRPTEAHVETPLPGPSRSPQLIYCKDIPNCPGHKPGSREKCKVKGKMSCSTPKKSAGPSNK